jgi:hypothetical protein
MTILLDCYPSKEILMSKLFDTDIATEITKQLKLTNNEDEIKYRLSIMEDIDTNYGKSWHKILTTIRFQAFHNKCICITMSKPNFSRFRDVYSEEFSGWTKQSS